MQFTRAIQALSDAEVEFVIIGGVSATLHGSARVTYDLDICYARNRENLRKLVLALAPFHPRPRDFPIGLPFIWDEGNLRNSSLLTLHTDIGAIDLLAEVSGLGDFDQVRIHAATVNAFGRRVMILDLPGLIHSKRAAGRQKDLAAIPELESLLEAND